MSNREKVKAEAQALSRTAQAVSFEELGSTAPEKKASAAEFAVWIRTLLQGWRQGTVGSKGRSDVDRSNKKPWKQKGTGRARAGSARSPLWRGGGVVFGPQPRVRTLSISKQSKKNVMMSLLSGFIEQKRLMSVDWSLQTEKPKTAAAYKLLKDLGLVNKRTTLLIPFDDRLTGASFINIPNVRVLAFDQMNAYDLANSDNIIVLKKDFDHLRTMVSRWS